MTVLSRFKSELAEKEASDRTFGVLTGIVFGLLALAPMLRGRPVRLWAAALAVLLLATALIRPSLLRGPKRAWLFLGFLIGMVVSPIVLAILFYFVITPIGFLMRLMGRDALSLRAKPGPTYWRLRAEPIGNMKEQF